MFVSIINGLISVATGKLFDSIPIPKINRGRGSFSAITKQITTKFYNGTIQHISFKTLSKMLAYNLTGNLIGVGVAGIMDAIGANDWLANLLYDKTGY